jgi:Ser-tRNA(Ala) deacylase AlaX
MLADEEIIAVETAVNEIIAMGIVLSQEFISRAEAESKYFTGKLPAETGDEIRIVKIGNYDSCPCIGPHVKSTAEVGKFIISTADFENEILRIRFKLE